MTRYVAAFALLMSACTVSAVPAAATREVAVESDAAQAMPDAGCAPASRVPEVGEDAFCPSVHDWIGGEPSSVRRHYMLEQCAEWVVCPVAYVADGSCFHCADVSDSPHFDD